MGRRASTHRRLQEEEALEGILFPLYGLIFSGAMLLKVVMIIIHAGDAVLWLQLPAPGGLSLHPDTWIAGIILLAALLLGILIAGEWKRLGYGHRAVLLIFTALLLPYAGLFHARMLLMKKRLEGHQPGLIPRSRSLNRLPLRPPSGNGVGRCPAVITLPGLTTEPREIRSDQIRDIVGKIAPSQPGNKPCLFQKLPWQGNRSPSYAAAHI